MNKKRNLYYLKLLYYILVLGFFIEISLLILSSFSFTYNQIFVSSSLLSSDYFNLIIISKNFYVTEFIIYLKIFICIIFLCIIFCLWDYFYYENYLSYEICLLMLLCIEGMFFIITSNDLFYIYLGIELQSLSLYILASLKKYSNLSIEAGLKYFLLGSFASGMFLYGISIIYVFLGTTCLNDLNLLLFTFTEFPGGNDLFFCLGIGFGMTMILVGLLFKLGIAPFHF